MRCFQDGDECNVGKSNRGKKAKSPCTNLAYYGNAENRPQRAYRQDQGKTTADIFQPEQDKHGEPRCLGLATATSKRSKNSQQDNVEKRYHLDYNVLHQELSYAPLISNLCANPKLVPSQNDRSDIPHSKTARVLSPLPWAWDRGCSLPEYIERIDDHVDPQDMQMLWRKGALELPKPELRNALVETFIEYVHPTMPVIDLKEFLSALNSSCGKEAPKISLLLFQAIMFSAAPFVDPDLFKTVGLVSGREARQTFSRRVELLYDMDVEQRPLIVIQALLLLTHCTERPGEVKGGYYWLGIAISMAYTVGLHRDQPHDQGTEQAKRLARRIWWTCYMRDRQHAQYLSHPMRIRDEDVETPALTVLDFDLQASKHSGLDESSIASVRTDQAEQAAIFILMVDLCTHIGAAISVHFAMLSEKRSRRGSNRHEPTDTHCSEMLSPGHAATVDVLHLRLSQWSSKLPPSCVNPTRQLRVHAVTSPSLFVHKAILHLSYQNTISTLHRCRARPPRPHNVPDGSVSGLQSWRYVYEAAQAVSLICQDLNSTDLSRLLPCTVATMQLSPILTYITQLRYGSWQSYKDVLQHLFHCVKVLETMHGLYTSASYIFENVTKILRSHGIHVLMDESGACVGLRYGGATHDVRYSPTGKNELDHDTIAGNVDLDWSHLDDTATVDRPPQAAMSADDSIWTVNTSLTATKSIHGTGQARLEDDELPACPEDEWLTLLRSLEDIDGQFVDVSFEI